MMSASTKLATLNAANTESASSAPRRTWSTQERQRIVEAAVAPGGSVAEVARLNDLNANLVFKWIRRSRDGWLDRRLGPRPSTQAPAAVVDAPPTFMPVRILEASKAAALPTPVNPPAEKSASKARREARQGARRGGMEISLPNGARVAIDANVDAGALRLVLAALGDL